MSSFVFHATSLAEVEGDFGSGEVKSEEQKKNQNLTERQWMKN